MGMIARFFGLGPRLDVTAQHTESFVFELTGGNRQYVDDADLDPVLDAWLKQRELAGAPATSLSARPCRARRSPTTLTSVRPTSWGVRRNWPMQPNLRGICTRERRDQNS